MDFSDIRTIIIGEAGEYGKRLVRYLEIHLSSAVRVYHFTTAEGMVSFKEEAEIYLLDERIIGRETEIFKTEEVDFTNLAGGTRLFLQI